MGRRRRTPDSSHRDSSQAVSKAASGGIIVFFFEFFFILCRKVSRPTFEEAMLLLLIPSAPQAAFSGLIAHVAWGGTLALHCESQGLFVARSKTLSTGILVKLPEVAASGGGKLCFCTICQTSTRTLQGGHYFDSTFYIRAPSINTQDEMKGLGLILLRSGLVEAGNSLRSSSRQQFPDWCPWFYRLGKSFINYGGIR